MVPESLEATVVVLLAGCVPETQVDGLVVHHQVDRVVAKHRRDAREGVGGVGDEQQRLAHGSLAHNYT